MNEHLVTAIAQNWYSRIGSMAQESSLAMELSANTSGNIDRLEQNIDRLEQMMGINIRDNQADRERIDRLKDYTWDEPNQP